MLLPTVNSNRSAAQKDNSKEVPELKESLRIEIPNVELPWEANQSNEDFQFLEQRILTLQKEKLHLQADLAHAERHIHKMTLIVKTGRYLLITLFACSALYLIANSTKGC